MQHRWLQWITVAVLAIGLNPAWACAICAPSAAEQTLTQRLFKSEAVGLGKALDRAGQYQLAKVVRGEATAGVLERVSIADEGPVPPPGTEVLLARSGGSWRVMAPMPAERAAWVQQLIALRRPPDASPSGTDWTTRLAFFAPDLENPVDAVAQVAYEEISMAPFGAMRASSKLFASLPLERWLKTPELADRFPLYALLYGFVAPPDRAGFVRERLLTQSTRDPQASSSAFMAALLEIQGDAGLQWLVRNYLAQTSRSDAEVQAALLALRVHVGDGRRLDKAAATAALKAFVQANPHRAGFAASDLGDWGQWGFVNDFEQLLDTEKPQVFASRYAMVLYLLRNPLPEAKAALERLRAKGRL